MRISEVYLSIQGEGPRVGIPTIFVRFAGCNLKCPGWPCDTQFAIDPAYRKDWLFKSPEEVYEQILSAIDGQPKVNICLTGGEPFLQPREELKVLVDLLGETLSVDVIECFSNGTLEYPVWALEQISFVMDWKLPSSGESSSDRQRLFNFNEFSGKDAVKFTIADEIDFERAIEMYITYINPRGYGAFAEHDLPQVFFGAVWDRVSNADLISWVFDRKLPWRFTMQIHNYVYDRNKRGI